MLAEGDVIGEWIVDKAIGEGGYGAVFLCRSKMSERIQAAVKVFKPASMDKDRERFVREVEALCTLQHRAIVRVRGFGQDDERQLLWMAMDLVDGEELTRRIGKGKLSEDDARRIFRQVADGLRHAHARGIAHRDIKPANIMVSGDGAARILDFGIAIADGQEHLTRSGGITGTIAYIAPETYKKRGQRSDPMQRNVYALGLVLYEALTRKRAFRPEKGLVGAERIADIVAQKLDSEPFDPGSDFSDPIRQLIRAATDPKPDGRPSMQAFAVALGATARSSESMLMHEPESQPTEKPSLPSRPQQQKPKPYKLTPLATETEPPSHTGEQTSVNVAVFGGMAGLLMVFGALIIMLLGVIFVISYSPGTTPPAQATIEGMPIPDEGAGPAVPPEAPDADEASEQPTEAEPIEPAKKRVTEPASGPAPTDPVEPSVQPAAKPEPPPLDPAEAKGKKKKSKPARGHAGNPDPPADGDGGADWVADPGPAPGKGLIKHTGDGRIWLVSDAGRFKPGDLDPDVYTVVVFFDGTSPLTMQDIDLKSGKTVTVACYGTLRICREKK